MRLIEGKSGLVASTLTFAQVGAVAEKAWREQRDALIECIDMAQVGDEERMKAIRKHLELRGTRLPALMHAMTIAGASDIVETACRAQRLDFARFTAEMTADELTTTAAQLVGAELDRTVSEGKGVAAVV